jgi:hypothetical protein
MTPQYAGEHRAAVTRITRNAKRLTARTDGADWRAMGKRRS